MLQANLRHHSHSLAAMRADLSAQAGLADTSSLEALLDRLPHAADRTLIILHNLDELLPGEASGYDDAFFETLNGIRNRPGIALLCVSEEQPASWPLYLDSMPLPPLSTEQILAELARLDPAAPRDSWPEIARWLAGQPAPYTLLSRPEAWPIRQR